MSPRTAPHVPDTGLNVSCPPPKPAGPSPQRGPEPEAGQPVHRGVGTWRRRLVRRLAQLVAAWPRPHPASGPGAAA
ncbi:hypothetical protein [Streptomyces sp. NBC_00470]|uniref:hypothetical protein n=1 Tax=Streptomyces sp. NBC_00470 TaxID=2975753 RepID=UPI0030E5D64E